MRDQLEVTPKQKLACDISAIVIIVAVIALFVLAYFGVLPLSLGEIVLPACLYALALICYSSAVIQKNPVSLWLGTAFAMPATVTVLVDYTALTYAELYPWYIATPGISCLVAMIFSSKGIWSLLKVALVFLFAGVIFALGSFNIIEMHFVWIAFTAYVVAIIMYLAIYFGKGESK